MTLDALPMEAPAGIELYAAVWASQGRGYAVKTDRGFIAVAGSVSFHSDTVNGAISGLRRKGRSAPTRAALIADMKSAIENFIARASAPCLRLRYVARFCEQPSKVTVFSVVKHPVFELLDTLYFPPKTYRVTRHGLGAGCCRQRWARACLPEIFKMKVACQIF